MARVVNAEQYLEALDAYLAVPGHGPTFEIREVVAWALAQYPPLLQIDPEEEASFHMAQLSWLCRSQKTPGGTRQMYCIHHEFLDEEGRMQQRYIWGRKEDVPPEFVRQSFRDRRNAIVADCQQLKRDVDDFNAGRPPAQHYQLHLDFTAEML